MDGYHVTRIHSDRGHEFLGSFETWMKSRGILLTRTAGDDLKSNGRAEVTVKSVKNQLKRILLHAEVGSSWWPLERDLQLLAASGLTRHQSSLARFLQQEKM